MFKNKSIFYKTLFCYNLLTQFYVKTNEFLLNNVLLGNLFLAPNWPIVFLFLVYIALVGTKIKLVLFVPKLVLITFFYSDQFWYGKRERAFCTQIDSKNTDSKSQLVYLKLTLDFNIMKVYGFIGQKPSFLFRPK